MGRDVYEPVVPEPLMVAGPVIVHDPAAIFEDTLIVPRGMATHVRPFALGCWPKGQVIVNASVSVGLTVPVPFWPAQHLVVYVQVPGAVVLLGCDRLVTFEVLPKTVVFPGF